MIAPATCTHADVVKHGRNRNGSQRWKCKTCNATFSDEHTPTGPLGNMQADPDQVFLALRLLCEGMGVRATARITGLTVKTITKAIVIVGEKCDTFMHEKVKGVSVDHCEIDEIWQFCGCKERNRHKTKLTGYVGDVWTFFGICSDSKLILAHESGRRTSETADSFLNKLRRSITGRCQITSDAYPGYRHAIPFKFLSDVDYSILIKTYQSDQQTRRYSPAAINTTERISQFGNPDMDRCSTSYIERFNLSVRTGLRRFTRLALGFSKNVDVHVAMLSIWVCHYNFSAKHGTLKTTPAIAAGITNKKWSLREVAESV